MSKAELGELFHKERVLKLPAPWPGWSQITVSETWMRRLVTVMISLFIVTLGISLISQLILSRAAHLDEQNRFTMIQELVTAANLRQALRNDLDAGLTPRPITQAELEAAIPAGGTNEGRIFAFVTTQGEIAAATPASANLAGKQISSLLPLRFVTDTKINDSMMTPMPLVGGEPAFVALQDLSPVPGMLLVIQKEADVYTSWPLTMSRVWRPGAPYLPVV